VCSPGRDAAQGCVRRDDSCGGARSDGASVTVRNEGEAAATGSIAARLAGSEGPRAQ